MADTSRTPRRRRARKGGTTAPDRNVEGGRLKVLTHDQANAIQAAALDILANIGMSDAPQNAIDLVIQAGGSVTADNRLTFPHTLITQMLSALPREVTLCGQTRAHDLTLGGNAVYTGTGGAAPHLIDSDGHYRPSTLADLYDAARLVDQLDHVHFFSRPVVARDMDTSELLDVNTAFAALCGTSKHVMTSTQSPDTLQKVADLCFEIAGSADAFRARPFLSLNINHAVPPLRFDAESTEVLIAAAKLGLPVHVNTFGQMGASSPVTIAGCVAQTMAETLAGMAVAWLANPDVKAVLGMRPMLTDLRTGGMAGGAGEQALLTATAVQMARHLGLPQSTIAGATDAKTSDAQSGYEKALSVSLAAQSGAHLITQACGMHAGLLGCALESYVIDNDMLGAILRSLAPIDVTAETLGLDQIGLVAHGEGHFLGQPETLARMQSDFLYPQIADRSAPEVWEAAGRPDIRAPARKRLADLLASHYPTHVSADTQALLRTHFDIRLPPASMRPKP